MTVRKNQLISFGLIFALLCTAAVLTLLISSGKYHIDVPKVSLGVPVPTPTFSPTETPTPTPIPFSVEIESFTQEINEGENATFTWYVSGPPETIHSTVVYYGTKSTSGGLTENALPKDTGYSNILKDFESGDYDIPLRFIGNIRISAAGTYFARAYASIDGSNYWTDEVSFKVKSIPKNEIKVVNYPSTLSAGQNGTFTWQITGPSATIGYTAIVASGESKSGLLDSQVGIPQTPYAELVKDFTSGSFTIPLTFTGNTVINAAGKYYFRAFTYINGKNIWSDEYSLTVQ
jgi:hypothetical protein